MESGTVMMMHSAVIALVAYLVMRFGLKQSLVVAEDRSVLLFSGVLMYMVLFGHSLPTKVNKNIVVM